MSRREARESAFKLLFQMEFRAENEESQSQLFLENYPLEVEDLEYFNALIQGVRKEKEKIDDLYASCLRGWKIYRLPKVDLIILRIAVYEIIFCQDIPNNATISEAVVLAKRYSTMDSKKYINGVLGKFNKSLALMEWKDDASSSIIEPPVDEEISGVTDSALMENENEPFI